MVMDNIWCITIVCHIISLDIHYFSFLYAQNALPPIQLPPDLQHIMRGASGGGFGGGAMASPNRIINAASPGLC